ncbi:alpha/beta hydrolase [Paenochrobactrum sp. BZR 201-1]
MVNGFLKSCLVAGILSGCVSFSIASMAETLSLASVSGSKQHNIPLETQTPVTTKPAAISPTGEGLIMIDPTKKPAEKNDKKPENLVRNRTFIYQFYHPDELEGGNPSRELVVLLHGSGGNEASLVPLARRVWPRAVLLGVRGRVLQDGGTRWYRKITAVKFDEKDVQQEADTFVIFISKLAEKENLDLPNATFVGYSNGANLLAATMFMHSDLVRRAVLMRSMPVLAQMPKADLSKVQVLTITGEQDKLYSPFAPALSDALRRSDAKLDAEMVDAGHMLGLKDRQIIRQWLASLDGTNLTDVKVRPKKH